MYRPTPLLREILEICGQAGKLSYNGNIIAFTDEKARQWCNGIWLEEYVQSVLTRLKAENRIHSWAPARKTASQAGGNEIDALFTINNRLYVIECKSSYLDSKILYKLDSVGGRLGGILTRSMLCSIDQFSVDNFRRSNFYDIKFAGGARLKLLRDQILEWIQK